MAAPSLKLTAYMRLNRHAVLHMISHGRCYVHLHLDWDNIEDWLRHPDAPIVLAWQNRRLIGVIAAATPIEGTSWLRLIAIEKTVDTHAILLALWQQLREVLGDVGVTTMGILSLYPWLEGYLADLGFSYSESIVNLERRGVIPLPSPRPAVNEAIHIRHGDFRQADQALAVDQAAFLPLWQMTPSGMRHAIREAALFTLAEREGRIVGYQFSTLLGHVAHLSRLGVLPETQGQGIGGALVGEMLDHFMGRGVLNFTVNTQASNLASRRVYERYGFQHAGVDTPFWFMRL
ncbi:MAG TPA: GNAT family N-acetyltransferase [Aggregatilineales bacterium]|nr:GNAT family N-acetyltransferase [Anaerolineales bacterium]HRE46867.1 GNAT family N-acetyltransferase [Aggregatilineales bacterium]